MGRYIPKNILLEIKGTVDIYDVVSIYTQLKKAGSNWKGLCPLHRENTPSFFVNRENQTFHCFGCGKGGNVFTFIMEKEGVDFLEAAHILANRYNIDIPEESYPDGESYNLDKILYKINEFAASIYNKVLLSNKGKKALIYLKKREINEDMIKKFQLGFAPNLWDFLIKNGGNKGFSEQEMLASGLVIIKDFKEKIKYDRFRKRIIFPIYNEYGKVVGLSGRVIDEGYSGGKYINSPETAIFKKSKVLYGLHLSRKFFKDIGYAILCEGPFDVISMHNAGFNNAIAPQGTAFTESQAKILRRYTNRVLIAFDGDSAGKQATQKAIKLLLPLDFNIKIITLPEGMDPDSMVKEFGREKVKKYISESKDFFDYLLELMAERKDISSPYGQAKVVKELLDYIIIIQDPILQYFYIERLAKAFNIPKNSILLDLKNRREIKDNKKHYPYPTEKTTKNNKLRNVSEENKNIKILIETEAKLLELIISNPQIGKMLDEELPPEYISKTGIGDALNTAVSLIINGEDYNIIQQLSEKFLDKKNDILFKTLTAPPEFPKNFDYYKAVSECIKKIKIVQLDRELSIIKRKILECSDIAEKKNLYKRYESISREKIKLNEI